MPTLTTPERALFDITQFPSVAYCYLSQPELVFEAPLTGAFYSAGAVVALSYGTPTIGAYTDIEPEQTLELWDAEYNAYGSQRIRLAATSTAIFVGRSAQGNKVGELQIADGATIRVYNERKAWSKIPYISPNGTQYKDQLAYTTDNASQPPVANAGEDILIIVADGTTEATIPLDALGDVPSFAVRNGATPSSYLWDLDDGTVDTGLVTDSDLTATFPLGERHVSLTVTDSNGITHTAYKFVVIATKAMCTPVRIAEEVLRPSGVSWRLTVNLDELPSGIREGTKVLYTQHDDYSLSQVAVRFSGWLGTESYKLKSAEKQQKEITIVCYDVAERLRQIHGFPLTVEITSGTSGWYRMPNANIDRLTHHYLQWHTNLLSLADFSWSGQGATYPLPRFTTDGASIWEQGDRLARAIGYALTCNSKGQIRVKGDPLILPTAAQAAAYDLPTQRTSTVVTTLTADDYGEHEFEAALAPAYYWLRGSAVVASASVSNIRSVKASAPSKTPGQGRSTQEETEQLVIGQLELNCRLANRYAARANPRMGNVTLNMVKSRHILEPADMEWIRVVAPTDVRAKYPYLSSEGDRYLVTEIVNRYDLETLRKNSTWLLEREFEGVVNSDMTVIDPPSPTVSPPGVNPNVNFSVWSDDYVPVEPTITLIQTIYGLPPVAGEGQGLIAIFSDGTIAVTNDFDTPSHEGGPTWVTYDHSADLGTNVLQWCRQSNSTDVTGWIVTDEKIIKGALLQDATPTFADQHTFDDVTNYRNIEQDGLFAPGLLAVVVSVVDGTVKETHTVNGGTTWAAETDYGIVSGGLDHSFADGAGGWVLHNGTIVGDRLEGDDIGGRKEISITYDFASPTSIDKVRILHERVDGIAHGSHDIQGITLRPIPDDNTGASFILTGGFRPNGVFDTTADPIGSVANILQISIQLGVTDSATSAIYLDRVVITADGIGQGVPGIHMATETEGGVFAGLGRVEFVDTVTPLYVSADYAGTFATDDAVADEDALLTGLVARMNNDSVFFHGYTSLGPSALSATYDDTNNLFRSDVDTGLIDITPIVDSVRFGPDWLLSRSTIAVSSSNGNVVCFVGVDRDRDLFGVFITNGALGDEPEWIQLFEPDADMPYRRCMFSSDASSLILFGTDGYIAYSENPLDPDALDFRSGNLSTGASIIGIASF
jgi:hypothetical protein